MNNKMTKRKPNQLWTKEEIKTVLKLWGENTTDQIAQQLGRKKDQISYIANQIRRAGHKLPKKRTIGRLQGMIKEVVSEIYS
jgi:hypothetical protein